jgi:hypothetical protein
MCDSGCLFSFLAAVATRIFNNLMIAGGANAGTANPQMWQQSQTQGFLRRGLNSACRCFFFNGFM